MDPDDLATTIRLLRQARQGDRTALDRIFERYSPRVRRIVALRLGIPVNEFSVAEDLVQDALMRAFEKIDQFEERSTGSFYHWMSTCVASSVNLHFRKEGAAKRGAGVVRVLGEVGLSASIFSSDKPGPHTRAERAELEERLERELLDMKPHHREAIVLKHLCGMTAEEVADNMGFTSAATARKVVQRAMAALRSRLGSLAPSDE